jgi:hypothetical protein
MTINTVIPLFIAAPLYLIGGYIQRSERRTQIVTGQLKKAQIQKQKEQAKFVTRMPTGGFGGEALFANTKTFKQTIFEEKSQQRSNTLTIIPSADLLRP